MNEAVTRASASSQNGQFEQVHHRTATGHTFETNRHAYTCLKY